MYLAIVFLPLAGALLAGFFGRMLGARASANITSSFVVLSALLSWVAIYQVGINGQEAHVEIMRWVSSGEMHVSWALRIDTLTAVMLVDNFLHQRLPDPLSGAAHDLPGTGKRVDDGAEVVDDTVIHQLDAAGLRVHFHLGDVTTVGIGDAAALEIERIVQCVDVA